MRTGEREHSRIEETEERRRDVRNAGMREEAQERRTGGQEKTTERETEGEE